MQPDSPLNPLRRAVNVNDGPLSYKFQRLRERLRAAIASGELAGKLPGERVLAERFNVNAKTLSKALTDLAAEGLLERSIGRGTFVTGTRPAPSAGAAERWLLVCDTDQLTSPLVARIVAANADCHVVPPANVASLRPSFVSGFRAVIDMSAETPARFLRDCAVRGMQVIAVGREPQTYSIHAVVMDRSLAMAHVAQDLMLAGHRRIVAVEARNSMLVSEGLRHAAQRFAPDAGIDRCFPDDVMAAIDDGISAAVCDSPASARSVLEQFAAAGVNVPGRVSVAAVGCTSDAPCSGYYVAQADKADAVLQLLADKPARPTTLWLAGRFIDTGSTAPTTVPATSSVAPLLASV